MTLEEVVGKRMERIRLRDWAPEEYLKLDWMDDGTYSTWVSFVSPKTQKAFGIEAGSQRMLWEEAFEDDEADWEPYNGVPVYGF